MKSLGYMGGASNFLEAEMDSSFSLATEHLVLRIQAINRALRAAVENQRLLAARLSRPDLASLCVTPEHVDLLFEQVDVSQSGSVLPGSPACMTAEEESTEAELRSRSAALGIALPLDQLARRLSLTPFEQEALLIVAAPELDRTYERIYAFVLDDLNRRFPSIDLLISLTATSVEERMERRHALSAMGTLRRFGVFQTVGEAPTELRQELRLAPGIFECLTGATTDIGCICRDVDAVPMPSNVKPPSQVTPEQFTHFADALADGSISTFGIWGPPQHGSAELVIAFARHLDISLRRLGTLDFDRPLPEVALMMDRQLAVASALGSAVWLDLDTIPEATRAHVEPLLSNCLANSPVLVFLTGEHPWRPKSVLRSRRYAEMELPAPHFNSRVALWSESFPELETGELERLASRFNLGNSDISAVSGLTRMRARLAGNGRPAPIRDHVAAACSMVTRSCGNHFGIVVQPKRSPDDLILSPSLHRQVLEVAAFHDLRSRVDGDWGFGHMSCATGTKALFTGEPGTGKTLSAEVIAGLLSLPLLKIDLARVVSKWVGETEKNLEIAFREAEESHSVLFFDEAEALFGKRAEVQHGTDRYANLEVSYLLQRLEASSGLVILASNAKDQIDSAFIRRFQVVVHFPRPAADERRRIWARALPKAAPVATDVNIEALAKLEMTGAGIVGASRTAAFLAADSGGAEITMAHLVRAAARQYRREARILMPTDLGVYGQLLQEAP
jgi:hypothetical protein